MKNKIITISMFCIIFILLTSKIHSQIQQEWVSRYNGPLVENSDDIPVAITKDHSRNIIVVGNTQNNLTNYDFYAVKYNSSGIKLWSRTFTNTSKLFSGSEELVKAVTIDDNNFIYITGTTRPITDNSPYDILTIKYSPDGDTIWSRQYNGPGNYLDIPISIKTDNLGFIYVGGDSYGLSPNNSNYTILKYDSNGNLIWEARYGNPPILLDDAAAMAIDVSGNIYLTGKSSIDGTSNYDYLTVKYNTAGVFQWAKQYDGPAHYSDFAYDMSIDHSGNVYVTGISCQNIPFQNYDIATVKYNSNGDEIWVRRYNGSGNWWDFARSVKFDLNDNVYISGYGKGADSEYDILSIKYDSSGTEQWVSGYNGNSNDSDKAYRSEVDEYGNVYVTGQTKTSNAYDIILLKNNTSGNLEWDQTINGNSNGNDIGRDLVLDNSNIYITGESTNAEFKNDFTTAKYSDNGSLSWIKTENESTYYPSQDYPNAMAADSNNNIYIGGVSQGLNGTDFLLCKYDNSGNQLWVSRYDGEANADDNLTCLSVDKNGYVYAIGHTKRINSNHDIILIKYDTNGNIIWIRIYDNSNLNDIPNSMAMDSLNNIYITGYSRTSANTEAIVTLKYNSDGIQQWVNVFADESGINRGFDIVLDDSSNVYVTGRRSYSITLKINKFGNTEWSSSYSGYEGVAIVLDDSSNVYVAGNDSHSILFQTNHNLVTTKYNRNGVFQWSNIIGPSYNNICRATDLAIDNDNNIIVTGFYPQASNTSKNNYIITKYSRDGNVIWNRNFNGSGNDDDKALQLITDINNNIYLTGQSTNADTLYDITTIRYDSSGTLKWQISYDGPISSTDIGNMILLDKAENIYVGGQSLGNGTENDFALIKYSQTKVGNNNNEIQIPQTYNFLEQNYPNPFNPSTNLEFGISELGFVSLKVYN
ncbi:MAG TPA: SBBP repeat-containing protein, partial [Ignavibacteria bacterium]|nr:SBBP repeat-containing protein [Ignavibacteria bacterium]